ncbi:hypothetical protein IQ07DRAFT_597214 [Pyrenochaeta sp. DS3sAY3a]|nr:hypothetical protein IQ07DRAFT_597214 [Pyrenochaeta sp. DS3sAY3a]
MFVVRSLISGLCTHHALVALALASRSSSTPIQSGNSTALQLMCPVPEYLDPQLFTWSAKTMMPLLVLYAGCAIRFHAYAQLGLDFTYRLARPSHLVKNGLYAYVRHPSYTGLFAVLGAVYGLFLHQRALVSCWLPVVMPVWGRWMVADERVAWLVYGGLGGGTWVVMMRRVGEEEGMMEREFGEEWRVYCKGTKRFVPFLV